MCPPPIDAAEFDAHKDISTIIVQFLCRNKDKGFSAKEIAEAIGINEDKVNYTMLKLGLSDLFSTLTNDRAVLRKRESSKHRIRIKIEDVTVNGITFYRCIELERH